MTKDSSAGKKKASKKLTPQELMATPKHMLAWLKGKKAREVVTRDTLNNCACLGANFLVAHGYRPERFMDEIMDDGWPLWLGSTVNALPVHTPITAARAISTIKRATEA